MFFAHYRLRAVLIALVVSLAAGWGAGIASAAPFAYITNTGDNTVTVIDTADNSFVTTILVDVQPFGVAVNPSRTRAYVVNANPGDDDTVSVIDTSTNTVVGSPILVGTAPFGVAVHPDGSLVYVANSGSDNVSVISTASNTVVATIDLGVGASPTGLAVTPVGTRVFVANSNFNNVSVISTMSNTVVDTLGAGSFPTAFGDFIGPAATHLSVAAPASATDGSAFSFTVSALDQYGHVDTSYTGTVHFTSSDGQAILPADTTLTNGVGTFSATLETVGNQTLAATDTVTESINGTSSPIAVSPAAATHLFIIAPSSATPGTAFSFTVTARDQFNNTDTSYAGTVHFTSSDGQAVLPANSTLTNGTIPSAATC